MAQVIKHQNGGSLTIDGNKYKNSPELIKQLRAYRDTLSTDISGQFENIIKAVESGKDVVFDASGVGEITSDNVTFDVSKGQKKRMQRSRSGLGSWFGYMNGGREQDARSAISALKGFSYQEPQPDKKSYDHSQKIILTYVNNDDGSRTWVNDSNNNLALTRMNELLSITDDDNYTGYKGINALKWARNNKEELTAIQDRMKKGQLTEADIKVLDDLGIFDAKVNTEDSINASSSTNTSTKNKQAYVDRGWNYDLHSPYVIIDKDGQLKVTDKFNEVYGHKAAMFNDAFYSQLPLGADQNHAWLKGYTRIGNHLYKSDDAKIPGTQLYNYLHADDGFYDLNSRSQFNAANDKIEYLWGQPAEFSKWNSNEFYHPWLSKQGADFRYRPLNGMYDIPENTQLIAYYTGDKKTELGLPILKYGLFDKEGNFSETDINNYTKTGGDQQPLTLGYTLLQLPGSPYNGMYVRPIIDANGAELAKLYINPETGDTILESNQLQGTNGNNLRLPKELAEALSSNYNFWNNLYSDKTLQDRFYRTLREGYGTAVGEGLRNVFATSTLTKDDYIKLGFDEDTAQKLVTYMENVYGDDNNSRTARWQKLIVPKNQLGGLIGTTKDVKSIEPVSVIKKVSDPTKTAGSSDWNLSAADKLQIASIVGDVAALVAAVPTGGNPIAAGVGMASTATQFAADVKRDGLDGSDVLSGITGLGLDAISLLPGAGITGKLAKTAKVLKKADSVIRPLLISMGAVGAVSALKNIVSGDYTLDDFKALSTGLFALKGAVDMGRELKMTKYMGKPNNSARSATDFRNDYIDDLVAKEGLGMYEGRPTRWANSDGTVKDYDKAIEDLTKAGKLNITSKLKAKWKAQAAKSKAESKVAGSKKYNPFGDGFIWDYSNRTLNDDVVFDQLSPTAQRTLGRLLESSADISGISLYSPSYGVVYNNSKWYRTPVFYKTGGVIKAQKGTKQPGEFKWSNSLKTWNPISLLDATDLAVSLGATKRMSDLQKDSVKAAMIGSQSSMPTEYYSQFDDFGISRNAEERVKNIRNSQFVSSDSTSNMLDSIIRDSQADQILAQRDAELTQLISRHNSEALQQKQQYSNLRTTIADENKKKWASGLAQLDMIEAGKIGQNADSAKKWIYNQRDNMQKEQNAINEITSAYEMSKSLPTALENLKKKYKAGFQALPEDERAKYSDELSWMQAANPIQYKADLNSELVGTRRKIYLQSPAYSGIRFDHWKKYDTPMFKKGGHISRFRKLDEQLLLDQSKAIHRALEKLSADARKLLIKLLS